jgi:hypothetical protein
VTITSRILKRLTISGCKVNIELHGSLSSPVIREKLDLEDFEYASLETKRTQPWRSQSPKKYLGGPRSNIRN